MMRASLSRVLYSCATLGYVPEVDMNHSSVVRKMLTSPRWVTFINIRMFLLRAPLLIGRS